MSEPKSKEEHILKVEGLKMHFPVRGGVLYRQTGSVKAVDKWIFPSVTARLSAWSANRVAESRPSERCIVRLLKPSAGKVLFKGTDLTDMSQSSLRPYRQDFQMVFQDPLESLDARMSVGELISEPMVIQKIGTRSDRVRQVEELLELVGLPKNAAQKFSFEFSGGQRPYRHCTGSCGKPGPSGFGRTRIGFGRRIGSKPGPQPAHGFAKRIGVKLFVHCSRLGRGEAACPASSRSCIWAKS